MKALKIELNCGKARWIFSAFCTFALVFALFAVPLWNFQKQGSFSESALEKSVSVVTVTKKRKKTSPIQKIEKKVSVPKENVIPRKQKVEEKIEKKIEQRIEQQVEENIAPSEENIAENVSDDVLGEENQSNSENAESASENAFSESVLSDSEKKAAASYKSYALGRIASKKSYPYSARSKGLEGKVRVRIVINPDGTVSETEILEKCEHEILNEACLDAIKKSAPFKKMKKGQNSMTLTFAMDFSLKEKKR